MKTYTFPEFRPETSGPWDSEPDKAQWIDTATDLDCLIVRNHAGALCGYVGVQPGHKWHGVDYDVPDVEVHGGLTFADRCQEGAEDGPGICHIPAPGRPANVWWLGFDCAHLGDLAPRYDEVLSTLTVMADGLAGQPWIPRNVYRTFDYVKEECTKLAQQVVKA